MDIDAILRNKIEMDRHTTAWELGLSLGVSPQILVESSYRNRLAKKE
jgi:hypothetical protein